jgi:alkaline phosphatase D
VTAAGTGSTFELGVASFDPLADRVLLWTAVGSPGSAGEVTWEVAADESLTRVVASGTARPGPAGTVTVDADGLEPATTYWYRFSAAGATSPTGRTRTLPEGSVDRCRLAVTCCARYSQSRFAVYRAIADADVDLVLHVGDYIYEDCKEGIDGREPEPLHDAVTLDDYRIRHAQYRRDPDLAALHARHPMVVVSDDHDYADNAWFGGAKSHDPDEHGPWADRRAAALTAHHEFLPKRLADPDDLSSSWRRLPVGDLVAVLGTETRVHGRDEQAGLPGTSDADDPDRTMLGDTQRTWLLDTVRDPSTRWVLLLSGTVVSELEIAAPDLLDGVLPEKYAVVDGRAVNTDQWDGYRAERAALAAALAQRHGGAVIVSGDIHSSWAIEGPLGPDGLPVAAELVCPPAATTPIGQLTPGAGELLATALPKALRRARWVDADHHGYLDLDIDTGAIRATWWWVDPEAEDPGPERARTWIVPFSWPAGLVDGDPGAEPLPTDADGSEARERGRWRRVIGLAAAAGAVVAARAGIRRTSRSRG